MSNSIIQPHGGKLCNSFLQKENLNDIKNEILRLRSWSLTDRQLCDVELILNGGFSPLVGFMNQDDYDSVCEKTRLQNNHLWPIPITLDITSELADKLVTNEKLVLRDKEGFAIALLTINDIWVPDKGKEAQNIYGTTDTYHPGVNF